MSSELDILLLTAGVILPIAVAFHVFLSRSGVYAAWVKRAAIIFCVAGLAWASIDWILLRWESFHLTRRTYDTLHGVRGLLGGVCIGIALSIWLSRPYRKNIEKPGQE
jgi:hypothetical protein